MRDEAFALLSPWQNLSIALKCDISEERVMKPDSLSFSTYLVFTVNVRAAWTFRWPGPGDGEGAGTVTRSLSPNRLKLWESTYHILSGSGKCACLW